MSTDPSERLNVAEQFPGIVMKLLKRLGEFDAASVPFSYPDKELAADPALHGGYWGPWRDWPYNWST